jgi:WD40 repeat protein
VFIIASILPHSVELRPCSISIPYSTIIKLHEMAEDAEQNIIPTSTPVRAFENGEEPVLAVAAFLDGERMVTSGKTLRLWNLKNGVVLQTMEGHRDCVWAVAISRDGKLIASGDEMGALIFWEGDSGNSLTEAIDAHNTWISSVDFSPNGAVLATSSSDWTTKLWSTETRQREGDPIDCGAPVHCVRYSPCGGLLALAAGKGIQIWIPGTRERVADFNAVPAISPNLSLAWTPDGARLLSAGSYCDPTIREWDSSTWKQVGDPWNGHTSDIRDIVVNPAGTLVASASHDKTVRLWRLSDRQTIASFQLEHSDEVFSVIFSTDGKHMLGGGYDNNVSEWVVPQDALQGDTVGSP